MTWLKLVFAVLLWTLWQVSGEFILPDHCFRFSRSPSTVLHSSGNKDDGFVINIRRSIDGARVGSYFEPDREYFVTLKNELPLVTFDDFLFWLTPSEPPMMNQAGGQNVSFCFVKFNLIDHWRLHYHSDTMCGIVGAFGKYQTLSSVEESATT